MPNYKLSAEAIKQDLDELGDDIQKIFPANADRDSLDSHFKAMQNLHLDTHTDALLLIGERLEALVEAVDRNTEAIYNTAKVQPAAPLPIGDDFIFALNTAINGFRKTNHPNLAAALSRGLREVEKARQS